MATTTNVSPLKINYLTQAQYDAATKNADEIYLTPNNVADYVVNQGVATSSANVDWWYRKWSSGLLETGCYWSGSTSPYSTGSGFGFYNTTFTFPTTMQPINTNYQVYAEIKCGSGHAFYTGTVGTKTTSNFKIYYGSTVTSGTPTMEAWITVRGYWK